MNSNYYLFMVRIKIIVVSLFFLTSNLVLSQNIGVLSAPSPISGCELSNTELVTIVIFNFGGSYSGSFDVSYEINGGAPITETITLSPFPATSTYSYTFPILADLSTANTYNFKFYTNLVGDINNSNDTLNNIIIVSDTLTDGGNVDFSQAICISGNSGVLNLTSSLGNTQFWQNSINGGASWNNIVNSTNTQNYTNLTQETWYRAVVKNGLCPVDTSSIAILSIDSTTIGGTISGSTSVCVPPNNGFLTLSGERGSIIDWEFSSNGGSSWNSLSTTTNSYNYINQPSTYLYRAIVQNGSCQIEYSDTAEVIVMNGAVGGTLSPVTQLVCSGINTGIITLSGHAGNVSFWEMSTNTGTSWTPIVDTSTTQSFTNLTIETWYRAILSDCNFDTSSVAKVFIESLPVGGTLSPNNNTVCINSNTGIISLTGESGNIIDWEFSTNGGSSWSSLSNVTNSYNYNNLTVSTMYRVIVGNGSCSNVYSDTATITVDNLADAGIISAPTNVCIIGNSGNLTSAGTIGTILDWESSLNGGLSWTSIGNTTNTNVFTNISQTTLFHVIATNGVCPNDTSQYLITVDAASDAGILFASDSVCTQSSGFNYLSGYVGDITGWETTTNNGLTWNSMAITTDTINYAVTTSSIGYRTFVKNGTCPTDTSNIISIDVFPYNITSSNDTTINLGDSAIISASGGLFYSWTPSSSLVTPNNASTIATPIISTNYMVSIVDVYGCIFSANVLVNVIVPIIEDTSTIPAIVIADLITANGDGYNDTWNIMGIENYPDSKVMVFNTSGNLVYESSNYTNDWKGTWQSNQLPDGTYYYIVEIFGETSIRKGFLTIVSQ